MSEYKSKYEENQRSINDFSMQKARLQTENGTFVVPYQRKQMSCAVCSCHQSK